MVRSLITIFLILWLLSFFWFPLEWGDTTLVPPPGGYHQRSLSQSLTYFHCFQPSSAQKTKTSSLGRHQRTIRKLSLCSTSAEPDALPSTYWAIFYERVDRTRLLPSVKNSRGTLVVIVRFSLSLSFHTHTHTLSLSPESRAQN